MNPKRSGSNPVTAIADEHALTILGHLIYVGGRVPRKQSDLGLQILEQVREWGRRASVPVIEGSTRASTVHLGIDDAESAAMKLCDILGVVEPYLVVTDVLVLSEDHLHESLETLASNRADDDRVAEAEACRAHIGEVASMAIAIFLKGGAAVLHYEYAADWMDAAYPDEEQHEDDGEEPRGDPAVREQMRAAAAERERRYEEAEKERARWTPDVRTAAAKRVAADPRFAKAKTEAARVYLTREVLSPDVPRDEYVVKEISREAKAVFDFGSDR